MSATRSETAAAYQTAAIMIGLAELALLLGVFLSEDTLTQHRMVSTNLFALAWYRGLLSVLVGLQLVVVLSFALRFRLVAPVWTGVVALFLCSALIGWVITVTCSPDTDPVNHSIGAGLFVAATAFYFAIVLNLTYKFDPIGNRRYDLMAYGIMLLAGVFAMLYVTLYFSSPGWAWLFENIAFVLTAAGYVVLFWYHPFDAETPIYLGQHPTQCIPLLNTQDTQRPPESDVFY